MPITARILAEKISARLEGDPAFPISGLASPESASPSDLIFLDSEKHAARAAASSARCVIVPEDVTLPGKTLLRHANPKLAFAKAAALLAPPPPPPSIHPTALIASTARLGAGVTVGPYVVIEDGAVICSGSIVSAFCFIGRNALLSDNCRLDPRVTLYPNVRLGHRVTIHSGAVIGSEGFGYVFGDGRHWKFPQLGTVEIADDVEIGANTCIDRGSLGVTRIGPGTKIDNLVQVAHNVTIGDHAVIAAQTGISGSSTIGSRAVLAGQAGIADHVTIEDGAVIGGQAAVFTGKIVRTGETVFGTPARPLEKFTQSLFWFDRLPDLAARLKKLEASSTATKP